MAKDLPHTVLNHLLLGLFNFPELPHQHIEDYQVLLILHLGIFSPPVFELCVIGAQILCHGPDELPTLSQYLT